MKKHTDQDLFGITFTLFDYRSAAFRQKMLSHYQSNSRKLGTNIEKIPGNKKNDPTILLKKSA